MATVEERFAQKLASNDLPVRNKALKRLNRWITARSILEDGFTELELLKLWKGLYVCMWHSDKPLVQEELAKNTAKLIHAFKVPDRALQFISAFFTTICREWEGIDRLRLDKFYTLIRQMVHHSFRFLQENKWREELVRNFATILSVGPLNQDTHKVGLGIQFHVLEVYIPELLLVADETCPGTNLIKPCFSLLANTTNSSVVKCIENSILQPLEKRQTLQHLHVDCEALSALLRSLAISRKTVGRNRKTMYKLCKRFSEMRETATQQTDNSSSPPPSKKTKKLKPSSSKKLEKLKKRKKLK